MAQGTSAEGVAAGCLAGGYLYLSLPACKMAQKAKGCPECQYQSCCALAERTVRLACHNRITNERHSEMKQDLEQTCPLASAYHDWLMTNRRQLRIPATSFKRTRVQRKEAVFTWLRQAATQSSSG